MLVFDTGHRYTPIEDTVGAMNNKVQHPLDSEHYVAKQINPIAEPVLATLGFDFERIIGDRRRQLALNSLFGDVSRRINRAFDADRLPRPSRSRSACDGV